MPKVPKERLFLRNYMEDLVWNFLDEVLAKYPEACSCTSCRHDMAAIALNGLQPRYVVREKGEVYSKVSTLEVQYRADIYGALTKAIMTVMSIPRH